MHTAELNRLFTYECNWIISTFFLSCSRCFILIIRLRFLCPVSPYSSLLPPSPSFFVSVDLGNLNVLAFIGGVFFIIISLGIFVTVVCFNGKRRNQCNAVSTANKKRGKWQRIESIIRLTLFFPSISESFSSFYFWCYTSIDKKNYS